MGRNFGLILVATLSAATPVMGQTPEALLQRIVAHLDRNRPIAGEFAIHTTLQPAMREQLQKDADKKSGGALRMRVGEKDQLLNCRWAWDKDRELTQTLPGSQGDFATFFRNHDATLTGLAKGRYNLDAPTDDVPIWRPASFYFLASQIPFTRAFDGYDLSIENPLGADEGGLVTLVGKKPSEDIVLRLTVDRESSVIRRADLTYKLRPFLHMEVKSIKKGPDHRLFPDAANLDLYLATNPDQPYRQLSLQAKTIQFPNPGPETDALFALDIAKGPKITDNLLNRQIDLKAPASVRDIIGGRIASSPIPASKTQTTVPALEKMAPSDSRTWLICVIGAVVLIAGLLLFRYRRAVPGGIRS